MLVHVLVLLARLMKMTTRRMCYLISMGFRPMLDERVLARHTVSTERKMGVAEVFVAAKWRGSLLDVQEERRKQGPL
jgi:hypothetical protein